MVSRYTIILLIGLLATTSVFPQEAERWNRVINFGEAWQNALSIDLIGDSLFIGAMAGISEFNDHRGIVVAKCDRQGELAWTKTYAANGKEYYAGLFRSMIETNDKRFALAGSIVDSTTGNSDILLIKFQLNGDTLWTKTYGGSEQDVGSRCIQLKDGGFVIIGYTLSYDIGNGDILLIRTDSLGNKIWHKTFGGLQQDIGFSITSCNDDGFLLGGYTESFGSGRTWCIKLNNQFEKQWDHVFDLNYDVGALTFQLKDGNYLFHSAKDNSDQQMQQGYIAKFDSSGIIWEHSYGRGGFDLFDNAIELEDGSIILTGGSVDEGANIMEGWIMKTNAQGDSLWSVYYAEDGYDENYLTDIEPTGNGGFVLSGFLIKYGPVLDQDVWLLKIDSLGCVVENCNPSVGDIGINTLEIDPVKVFPNPAPKGKQPVNFYNLPLDAKTIRIYGIAGYYIATYPIKNTNNFSIPSDQLEYGIMLYEVITQHNTVITGKFMVH